MAADEIVRKKEENRVANCEMMGIDPNAFNKGLSKGLKIGFALGFFVSLAISIPIFCIVWENT